jgi:hypothetical protein
MCVTDARHNRETKPWSVPQMPQMRATATPMPVYAVTALHDAREEVPRWAS